MKTPVGVAVFDKIAEHYEFTSKFLSFGVLPYLLSKLDGWIEGGGSVLDLACGTGVLFPRLSKKFERVVGLDYSLPMLLEAKKKNCPKCFEVRGDALRLPFKGERFDAVVVSLGLRHFWDIDIVLGEIARVLKRGGRFYALEVGIPRNPILGRLFLTFLRKVILPLGKLRSKEEIYDHLFGSIMRFPHGERLLEKLNALGFEELGFKPVMGGIAYIYKGTKR